MHMNIKELVPEKVESEINSPDHPPAGSSASLCCSHGTTTYGSCTTRSSERSCSTIA